MRKYRVMGQVGIRSRSLVGGMALIVIAATAVSARTAAAAPKGEYAVFSDCPLASMALNACISSKIETGKLVLDKTTIPIENPITLQGGFVENEATGAQRFVGAADGNTLSKAPQKVPGGLAGLVNCDAIGNLIVGIECDVALKDGETGVNATTELAAPANAIGLNEENLLGGSGTALSLPVKVHLENPLFGSECYIGSNTSPVVINLTTGTTSPPAPNKPISGGLGIVEVSPDGSILILSKDSLVSNSFAAPDANGCGGSQSSLIDPILNAKLGLPSMAGRNTAVLAGTFRQTGAARVREH